MQSTDSDGRGKCEKDATELHFFIRDRGVKTKLMTVIKTLYEPFICIGSEAHKSIPS
mgnify:CR=1 FL=1